MQKVKILFLGSNWESVETLKSLNEDSRYEIVGVITQPDKPVGRKKILTPTKVKEYAENNNLPLYYTLNQEKRYQEALELFKPELIVCIAFGEWKIPSSFLEAPKYKSINVHFSILPKYRGAVPIQMAILNGEKETGISVMQMSEKFDTGRIFAIFKEPILDTDTNQSLRERLVKKSGEVLPDVLKQWIKGNIEPAEQDNTLATYCWKKDIAKDKAQIDWKTMEPEYIERMVRAFIPWPVVWTMYEDKRMKIFKSKIVQEELELKAGEFKRYEERLLIGTKEKNKQLEILELQIEGKTNTTANEFLVGKNI